MGGAVCKPKKQDIEVAREISLPDIGVICITIIQAEFVQLKGQENNDPFFVVTLGTRTFRTKTVRKASGVWNQKIVMPLDSPTIGYKLKLSLYDHDDFSKNDFLASEFFDIEKLMAEREFKNWVEMKTSTKELIGKVEINVQYIPKQDVIRRFWLSLAKIFDADKSNFLDRAELASLLESMGHFMTDAEIEQLFLSADKDKDDRLQFDEFMDEMMRNPDMQKISLQRDPITNEVVSSSGEDTLVRMVTYVDEDDATDIVVSRFLSEEHASKGWLSRIVQGTTFKEQDLCENSEFVQFVERSTGEVKQELIPTYIKLAMRIMYSNIIGKLHTESKSVKKMLAHLTNTHGQKYNSPNSKKEIQHFVKFHGLNVDEILEPIDSFKNFNEFFYRKLKASARPIAEPGVSSRLVSPADCRCLVFQTIDDAKKIWIKGKQFTVESLLNDKELAGQFVDGSMVISRLAPQDYHRFHSPVDCKVIDFKPITGAYYTVNPIAIRQKFDVYTENKRIIGILESPDFGKVIYVMIGATMVGSIITTVKPGDTIKKGDEIGYFAFGGSTIVTLFQKDKVKFDKDLVENSTKPLESRVFMGDSLGVSAPSQKSSS